MKYVLFKFNFTLIINKTRSDKNSLVTISWKTIYFLTLHIKLTSSFFSTQLIEIFSYEMPLSASKLINNMFVYNFHTLLTEHRLLVFALDHNVSKTSDRVVPSISEIFLNANWLEREVAELHGTFFSGKKDVRNLMLQYGDRTAPFQKAFPAIGTKEIFYDVVNDILIQLPTSIQN